MTDGGPAEERRARVSRDSEEAVDGRDGYACSTTVEWTCRRPTSVRSPRDIFKQGRYAPGRDNTYTCTIPPTTKQPLIMRLKLYFLALAISRKNTTALSDMFPNSGHHVQIKYDAARFAATSGSGNTCLAYPPTNIQIPSLRRGKQTRRTCQIHWSSGPTSMSAATYALNPILPLSSLRASAIWPS